MQQAATASTMISMLNKRALLLLLVLVLSALSLYLVYIIQDGSSPLALFNTRADEGEALDPELEALLAQAGESPTPTIPYNSTSPSPTTSISPGATSPTIAITVPATLTSTPTPVIEYITATPFPMNNDPIPTAVTSLPVAGFADEIPKYLIGGGLLVLVAMFL